MRHVHVQVYKNVRVSNLWLSTSLSRPVLLGWTSTSCIICFWASRGFISKCDFTPSSAALYSWCGSLVFNSNCSWVAASCCAHRGYVYKHHVRNGSSDNSSCNSEPFTELRSQVSNSYIKWRNQLGVTYGTCFMGLYSSEEMVTGNKEPRPYSNSWPTLYHGFSSTQPPILVMMISPPSPFCISHGVPLSVAA